MVISRRIKNRGAKRDGKSREPRAKHKTEKHRELRESFAETKGDRDQERIMNIRIRR